MAAGGGLEVGGGGVEGGERLGGRVIGGGIRGLRVLSPASIGARQKKGRLTGCLSTIPFSPSINTDW
jgi:hypothetical protein